MLVERLTNTKSYTKTFVSDRSRDQEGREEGTETIQCRFRESTFLSFLLVVVVIGGGMLGSGDVKPQFAMILSGGDKKQMIMVFSALF